MQKSQLSVLAVAALAAVSLSACEKEVNTTATESGLELVEEGVLTICTHLPYEPFEFTEGGEVVGFDIDVLTIVAEAEDPALETRVVDTPWETITTGQALENGDCDVAAGAMTITDEREEVMDFSDPYFEATQALLVPAGAPYAGIEDLAGKRIAVQEGTTGEAWVEENLPEGAEKVSFEDSALMMTAVKTGKTDAGVNDNGLVEYFVSQNPDTEIATEFQTDEFYGFSVKKDSNEALLEAINAAIADEEAYNAAYEKWFGTTPE